MKIFAKFNKTIERERERDSGNNPETQRYIENNVSRGRLIVACDLRKDKLYLFYI